MPTLWKMDASPPACAVRVLGDILGIEFDYVDVDFRKLEHKAFAFMKINPLGTVPLLKDEGFMFADSHAMLKYLLKKYGSVEQQESLYPSDLKTQALMDQAQYFDAAVFFIRLKAVTVASLFEGLAGPTPKQLDDIEAAYAVVEVYLGDKKFIATDHLTLADISVGVTAAAMQPLLKLDKNKFPHTVAWLDNLYQIPAFKKYCIPGFEFLKEVIHGAWEKNKQRQH